MERRRSVRTYAPYPALVRGRAARRRVEFRTVLDNVSGGGLHLYLPRAFCEPPGGPSPPVAPGSELFFDVDFSAVTAPAGPAPRAAILGRVLRVTRHPGGACCVAGRILAHRFFPSYH